MDLHPGDVTVHFREHGAGLPVLVLHGAGVDHHEVEACFEPILERFSGLRRIYPDLPGMGRTPAPDSVRSADDVLETLLAFADRVAGGSSYLLAGHSAGGYFALAMADRRPAQVAGLALVCPLLAGVRDVPEHRVVAGSGDLGDEEFRSYFVVQTPEMLERYERFVAPAAALVDEAAMERIGARWELGADSAAPYPGPMVVVAGRLDSTVGYAAAADLLAVHPHATLAVVDGAGHALPHERPELLRGLLTDWLTRIRHDLAQLSPLPTLASRSYAGAHLGTGGFMELSSAAIPDGSTIDRRHIEPGIGGDNVSPDLTWTAGPDGTQSYCITCFDPDAPTGSGWWHWLVTDIPASVTSIPNGGPLPDGARTWPNDYAYPGWGGPWPPPGPAHHYVFTVHAMSVPRIDSGDSTPPAMVRLLMHFAELDRASFTAVYATEA